MGPATERRRIGRPIRLLARPRSKEALVRQLRDYLHQVCHALGLPTRIVPHQFRHTYATEMLRAGVSFLRRALPKVGRDWPLMPIIRPRTGT
ncbi:MAG: hypothetical protein DMG54_31625 [Acidobacteria bacterium]|nr:MAG: hypothetical protein DMG54_31625 [Acidobacteriota bacterium]PYU71275.1 MAG: hypothetical protein DMG52_22745 [Acidobacteriota bacterium]